MIKKSQIDLMCGTRLADIRQHTETWMRKKYCQLFSCNHDNENDSCDLLQFQLLSAVSIVRDRIWIPTSEPFPRGPLDTTRHAVVEVSGIELPTCSMHHYLRSVHGSLKVGPICNAFATFSGLGITRNVPSAHRIWYTHSCPRRCSHLHG